jgi:hypothetical protein
MTIGANRRVRVSLFHRRAVNILAVLLFLWVTLPTSGRYVAPMSIGSRIGCTLQVVASVTVCTDRHSQILLLKRLAVRALHILPAWPGTLVRLATYVLFPAVTIAAHLGLIPPVGLIFLVIYTPDIVVAVTVAAGGSLRVSFKFLLPVVTRLIELILFCVTHAAACRLKRFLMVFGLDAQMAGCAVEHAVNRLLKDGLIHEERNLFPGRVLLGETLVRVAHHAVLNRLGKPFWDGKKNQEQNRS